MDNWFNNNPKKTFFILFLLVGLLFISLLEGYLRWRYSDNLLVSLPHNGYRSEKPNNSKDLPKEFTRQIINLPGINFTITYSLYGGRHPDDLDKVKLSQGNIKLMFLGDSYTLGWPLADNQSFGSLFGKLSGTQEFNLICGLYAAGTNTEKRQLLRVLANENHIETIVYQIFGNDVLFDLGIDKAEDERVTGVALNYYFRPIRFTFELVMKQLYDVYRRLSGHGWRNYETRRNHVFGQYGPILKEDILSSEDTELRRQLKIIYIKNIIEIIDICRKHHIRLITILIPYAECFEKETAKTAFIDLSNEINEDSVREFREFIRNIFLKEKLPLIDFYDIFAKEYQKNPALKLYVDRDLHLNSEGHRLIANSLYKYFLEH